MQKFGILLSCIMHAIYNISINLFPFMKKYHYVLLFYSIIIVA